MPNPVSALQAALLPFAIAQDLAVPCAYERSIKISPSGLLTNRFLISIDSQLLTLAAASHACERLGMPAQFHTALQRRYARAAQFIMGYEEGPSNSVLKVYLEFRNPLSRRALAPVPHLELPEGHNRPAPKTRNQLSHIGWKWTTELNEPSDTRTTLYRRVTCLNTDAQIAFLQSCLGTDQSAVFQIALHALQRADSLADQLTYLKLLEGGKCRGFDLNLYPANMAIDTLGEPLKRVMTDFGLPPADYHKLMTLGGSKQLGHLSGGPGYLTLYYLP